MDENITHEITEKADQFIVSHELLCLLQWLINHDIYRIKRMITRALNRGFKDKLANIDHAINAETLEDAQINILEFFAVLETILAECMQEQTVKQAIDKGLMPAIDQIDPSACNDLVVHYGLERANAKISKGKNNEKPQDILLEEILKSWKPANKKQTLN